MPDKKCNLIKEKRNRKFNPKIFFLTLLHLATGMNLEGYDIALDKTFETIGDFFQRPFKSSLSKIRKRISYEFVKDEFDGMIDRYKVSRPTCKGYFLYSVDGDEYYLPPTNELIDIGFRGYPWAKGSETYNLKMYTVTAIDPMTGVPMNFDYSVKRNEIALAEKMIPDFEKNSIAIYDRLYFSFSMVLAHKFSENFFLFRCKKGATLKVVIDFVNSTARETVVEVAGLKIRLIKCRNKKNNEDNIFATNLPERDFSNFEIQTLYFRRWESELGNRDITCTLKMEQFHTDSFNGILQEIYMKLWYVAFSKIQIATELDLSDEFLEIKYKKANWKEVMIFILRHIDDLIFKMKSETHRALKFLIHRSIERRKHKVDLNKIIHGD